MAETAPGFTLAVLLEAKRIVKAEQNAVCCAECGKPGVANHPDSIVEFTAHGTQIVHAGCLAGRPLDLPKAGSFSQ